jgi:hypothetical protein
MEKAEAVAAQAVQECPVVAVPDDQSVIVHAERRLFLQPELKMFAKRPPL